MAPTNQIAWLAEEWCPSLRIPPVQAHLHNHKNVANTIMMVKKIAEKVIIDNESYVG